MDTPQTFSSEDHTYRVIRELSEGGQGKTLLVEREGEPGSSYVLKLLRLEHVEDWKQVELFEREVTTLGTLTHPGIPRLIDRIVEDDRTAGIVQTEVPGQTLAQKIAEHQPLPPERFEQIVRQSLEILTYLQQQVPPVLHRDINPRNVMIDEDRTYLIDFGAVRVGGKTDMTSVGTFGYMAPEQIIGRPVPASDMYGLGMTLVSLAERRDVGDLPVDASTGQVDRTKLLRGMESRLREAVLGMIEPGLAERVATPQEALRRLDAPPAPPALRAPPAALAVPELTALAPGQRKSVPIALSIGLVMLAVSVGMYMLTSVSEPAPVLVEAVEVRAAPAPAPVLAPPVVAPPAPPTVDPVTVVAPPAPPSPPPQAVPDVLTDDNSAALELFSSPEGATVTIDGVETCTTPCTARVAFGERRIVLDKGGQRVERTMVVLEDTSLRVSLTAE